MKSKITSCNKIYLRKANQNDVDFLTEMKNDLGLQELLMCHQKNHSQLEIKEWIEKYESSKDSFLLVVCESNQKAVGYFSVQRFLSHHKTAYFGIAIHPDFQGLGYGKTALFSFFEWANKELGLRKVLLEVASSNQRAITIYKKAGFREVGILMKHFFTNHIYQDAVLMEKDIS